MLPINQYLTVRNRTVSNRTSIQYLVIHYVGAVSSAKANCNYFYSEYRGASAHYFVDDNSIWQCVEDKNVAWHCGANTYYNGCRNTNSIGIEMCCYNNNGIIDMSDTVISNTIELAAYICKKYGISIDNVVRHYDVTHKQCPAPFVANSSRWDDFKNRLSTAINGEVVTPTTNTENNTMNKSMYVSVNSSLNIRSGAGTGYSIVGSLKNGQQVTVYEMSNNWARIGSGQWVCATYLKEGTATTVTTKTKYVSVNSSLNIRIGAGTNYRTVGSLSNGIKVTVYEESNGWSRIGDAQWVSSQYLTDSAPVTSKIMYVTASALNVRTGIGTSNSIVTTLTKGAQVTVYEESNGWSRIGDGKWVSSQYLSSNIVTASYLTKYVTASKGLNVRAGAGTGYKIVKTLLKGTKVTVYETKNGWSRIGDGQWVSSAYIA
jgi:uncharacterized protein YgiM (DUF1202 family)